MAWDTDATRRKLLDAATVQFAAVGLAGARVNVIADAAGVNKERIYQYFGDKAGLFDAVLSAEVERLLDGVGQGVQGDVITHVAEVLQERAAQHPHLPRLLAWEGLELDKPVSAAQRAEGCASMVATLVAAYPRLERGEAEQLLLSLISMSFADQCLPHLASLIAPARSPAERRAAVVRQARALAAGVA